MNQRALPLLQLDLCCSSKITPLQISSLCFGRFQEIISLSSQSCAVAQKKDEWGKKKIACDYSNRAGRHLKMLSSPTLCLETASSHSWWTAVGYVLGKGLKKQFSGHVKVNSLHHDLARDSLGSTSLSPIKANMGRRMCCPPLQHLLLVLDVA